MGKQRLVVIVMVNYKRRREVVESDSERSEENQYMDNTYEEIHHARSQRSPEEEKDEAHISVIAPEIRDVLGESDDEEPVDYEAAQTMSRMVQTDLQWRMKVTRRISDQRTC
nr:protein LEO1 homolog isoform X1 [Tanacetum cinerariifolium]